jgi:hypothetical protein
MVCHVVSLQSCSLVDLLLRNTVMSAELLLWFCSLLFRSAEL